jgi:ABC-type uncharacterized transport system permease subunit|tara:strand:+ start:7485 stop:8255 length:771 start_codon:yes stop_codon:yes gene_type:complete
LASLLYLGSAGIQLYSLKHSPIDKKKPVIVLGMIAVLAHGIFSFNAIFTLTGINLGIFEMASVVALAISAIVVLSSLHRPVVNLVIAIFPLAVLTIVGTLLNESTYTPRQDLTSGIGLHVVLSVLSYGLLAIAALQAILLSFGDYELRHKKMTTLRYLPPLQTMESLLFELLWAGLVFLSLSILSGFVFFEQMSRGLIHHTSITLIAWVVFSILLWGRYRMGWRGATASRWTLSGFALLLVGYFGSKLVMEIFLAQ